jgi:hypothetical protein
MNSLEKFCLETGDVLGHFSSLAKAAKSLEVSKASISLYSERVQRSHV